jgi:thiol-disulfide isomerase/thioredoxin
LLVACWIPIASGEGMPTKGDVAPQALGATAEGETLEAAQFRGKVLVVTFWASWCGPCMKELPMLEALQRVAGKAHLRVVAVNIEDRDVFRKIARKLDKFQLTLAHDAGKRGSEAYGVHGIPHMVIVGRDGTIVKVNRGYSEEALDGIVKEINAALLAGQPAPASPT